MSLRTRLRLLLGLLLLAVCAAFLCILFYQQPGYVLIAFKGFRYESSLWFFLALFGGLWFAIWLLGLLVRSLLLASGWLNPWSKRARIRRAGRAEQRGLLALAEGRFERALPCLKKAAGGSEQPLLALLAAARAAQQLGDNEQSQALLEQAKQQSPEHRLAIDLAQAELQIQRGEPDSACQTLKKLHWEYPNHLHVLRQLRQLLEQQQDWLGLQALLPKLQKYQLLSQQEHLEREQRAACLRLSQAAVQANTEQARMALDNAWNRLPKSLRGQAPVLIGYVEQLARLGAADEAEQRLSRAIKRHYDPHLADCYGKLQTPDPEHQLKTAEGWLKTQPEDAALLLALARLTRASGFLGKARSYYEASLFRQSAREPRAELAQLLLEMGETRQSAALLKQALKGLSADNDAFGLTLQKSPGAKT